MTNYIGNMDGGQTSVEGHNRRTRITMSQQGIVSSTHLLVAQTATPSASVTVLAGDLLLFLNDYFLHAWATTTNTIAITANSSGNPRIDKIVAYADLSAFTPTSSNNPGAFKIVLISGTPAVSPVAPSDVAIQAAIGAGNPFMSLATIAVANGFTTIVDANITDNRQLAQFIFPSFSSVTLAQEGVLVGTDTSGVGRSILELADNNVVKIGDDTAAISQAVITTTGSANTYTATLTPSITAYSTNMQMKIKIHATNTGASTININGLGAKSLTKNGTTALSANDLMSDAIYEIVYDGTRFQVAGVGASSSVTFTEVTSFQNSWVNFGSGYATAAYAKDANGFVYLRGLIKSGTNAYTCFNLPVGYRPSATIFCVGNSNASFGNVNITSAGEVQPSGTGSATWFSLTGIVFHAS